ncbi:deoxyribonuclease V [Candidatus Endoriftia persephone]|uniref:deoxyribonuclease V n=2 Tax=Gammaproteobacteria TaxID=1236 RepID=UPI002738C355|nr:deoxyribonuclease V [Candidatus Endoriftia persephone]
MDLSNLHDWNLTPQQARELQQQLSLKVIREDRFTTPRFVAGVDVGFEDGGATTRAAVALLRFPSLELLEHSIAHLPTRFPYLPGLLSFREIPAILEALKGLETAPDMLLCDGQGLAHPRRFGLACHLGLITDTPSIGVAKSRLIGTHAELPAEKGAWVTLEDKGEIIGAVLRSRSNVNPLYISIGQRISLASAIHYTLACTTRYKLPETTRWAHRFASG